MIQCRRCEHNRTLRLQEIVPDVTVMDHTTDTLNRLFAEMQGWTAAL
jgi:hypothetical protein